MPLLLTMVMMMRAPMYEDKLDLMCYFDAEGARHVVRSVDEWQIRRDHILANMQLVMGEMPDDSRSVAPDVEVLEESETDNWTRRKITFATEAGDRVPAYLFVPKGVDAPGPAMLCLHQTTEIGKGEPAGIGGKPELHYALELAERGYVTLAPDYPTFGDYETDVYAMGYASATMKGIWNHMRAVDLLASMPEVDADRIGVIGHSLGGHNSLFVASFDERLKVIVTSCGFTRFAKYYDGNLTGWTHKGYMPRIAEVYGTDPARMPWDFTEVLGALTPRPVFVNAPLADGNFDVSGVRDCLDAAKPVYALLGAVEKLVAEHPDAGHGFPDEVRMRAYAFIDAALK